jgi:hypothetical protein
MKAQVKTILAFVLLLAFLLFPLSYQTLADEDVRYVYPVIETNCDQINATAYRFQPGDTLNYTYTFTTSGHHTIAYIPKNYTTHLEIEYPPGHYTSTDFARFYVFEWIDGVGGPGHNECFRLAGDGTSLGYKQYGFSAGEHEIKIVYLFKAYGDYKGYFEINFHSERKLRLEEVNSPMPTPLILIGGISGASIAFIVSAVIWHKKNSAKKEENDVNRRQRLLHV